MSGLGGVAKASAELDVVRKPRLVTLEMGTWLRELLGCRSNLTKKWYKGVITVIKGTIKQVTTSFRKL